MKELRFNPVDDYRYSQALSEIIDRDQEVHKAQPGETTYAI